VGFACLKTFPKTYSMASMPMLGARTKSLDEIKHILTGPDGIRKIPDVELPAVIRQHLKDGYSWREDLKCIGMILHGPYTGNQGNWSLSSSNLVKDVADMAEQLKVLNCQIQILEDEKQAAQTEMDQLRLTNEALKEGQEVQDNKSRYESSLMLTLQSRLKNQMDDTNLLKQTHRIKESEWEKCKEKLEFQLGSLKTNHALALATLESKLEADHLCKINEERDLVGREHVSKIDQERKASEQAFQKLENENRALERKVEELDVFRVRYQALIAPKVLVEDVRGTHQI
jgi:cell division protein FtsB